jgi:hypothetical protein
MSIPDRHDHDHIAWLQEQIIDLQAIAHDLGTKRDRLAEVLDEILTRTAPITGHSTIALWAQVLRERWRKTLKENRS